MAEMQHGSHGNRLWFVFANVSVACPVCVQYNIHSNFVITGRRPAYARIYPVTRDDLAAETFFHVQGKSSMLSTITTDDVITWFGVDGIGGTGLIIPEECLKRSQAHVGSITSKPSTESTTVTTPGSVSFITSNQLHLLKLMNSTSIVSSTETSTNFASGEMGEEITTTERSESSTLILELDEDTDSTTEYIPSSSTEYDGEIKKVLLGEVETESKTDNTPIKLKIYPNANHTPLARHFETSGLRSVDDPNMTISHDYKVTQIYKPDQTLESPQLASKQSIPTLPTTVKPLTHQTTLTSAMPSKTLSGFQTIRHVNTIQVQNIPEKFIRIKVENDDENFDKTANNPEDNKHYEYVLLNKESLWSMLKEAVDDEFRKGDLKSILEEKEIIRS